eukprot:1155170-Pelagomonas_calceolata.AAC.5
MANFGPMRGEGRVHAARRYALASPVCRERGKYTNFGPQFAPSWKPAPLKIHTTSSNGRSATEQLRNPFESALQWLHVLPSI